MSGIGEKKSKGGVDTSNDILANLPLSVTAAVEAVKAIPRGSELDSSAISELGQIVGKLSVNDLSKSDGASFVEIMRQTLLGVTAELSNSSQRFSIKGGFATLPIEFKKGFILAVSEGMYLDDMKRNTAINLLVGPSGEGIPLDPVVALKSLPKGFPTEKPLSANAPNQVKRRAQI